ncbi:MAG: hypothetical protein AAFX40_05580, partial [Cyanobacteria bacterium J06639_1]
ASHWVRLATATRCDRSSGKVGDFNKICSMSRAPAPQLSACEIGAIVLSAVVLTQPDLALARGFEILPGTPSVPGQLPCRSAKEFT